MTKPLKKCVTRQSRDEDTDECLDNYQSSDEDDYAPQISEVPAITSEKFIREYNVIRKPTEIPLNSDPANQISPNLAPVPSYDSENAGYVSREDPSEPEYPVLKTHLKCSTYLKLNPERKKALTSSRTADTLCTW